MRSKNTFGVSFALRLNKNKKRNYSVFARISCNNSPERELTIKGDFDPRDWDEGKGRPFLHNKALKEFATHLEKVKAKLTSIFQDMELKDDILTAENIKNHYLGQGQGLQHITILELCKRAYEKYETELKPGSLKNYSATTGYIERFCESKYLGKDLPLRQVNFSFIDDLYTFILSNPIKSNDPCNRNGAMKHMERLKKMVRWAGQKGWCNKDVLAEFKIRIKRKETEYLNWGQLQQIERLEVKNTITRLVKGIFLFCCYTGMAPIDAQQLRRSQLSTDMFGNVWMTYTRVKSDVPAWVPLLDRAKELLEQHCTPPGLHQQETVFPHISNKVLNQHLKVIGLACDFDFELHAYMARHTFGTTVTTQMGVPVEVTKIMMGHEKLETTMIYTRVGNPLVMMYMQRVQQKINSGNTMSINGINEEQFITILERIAPQVLEKVFANEIVPKLLEVVQHSPHSSSSILPGALKNAI